MTLLCSEGDKRMVTVAHIVAKLIRSEPIIENALAKDLFNYSKLASYFHPKVEKEMRKPVKHSAIMMAIVREAERIRQEYEGDVSRKTFTQAELSARSGIAEIVIQKSETCFEALAHLYSVVDISNGDMLTISLGRSEVSIIFTERYIKEFKNALKNERISLELMALSEITLRFPKDYLYEPGFIYIITRNLAWHGINIIELVSTLSELVLVIKNEDITRAYAVLQDLFTQKKND